MPVQTAGECAADIRNAEYKRLYFFYGRDTGASEPFEKKLVGKLCPGDAQIMNLHRFDAEKLDAESLFDAVQVLPVLADRVVVEIRKLNMEKISKSVADALRTVISDIPETTVIIIDACGEEQYKNKKTLSDKNKRFADKCAKYGAVCEFACKSVSQAARLAATAIAKRGSSISAQDAQYLASLCLCETAHINQEIEKLTAYADGSPITRADIDALCVKKTESDGYTLAISVLKGNAYFVFDRLNELKLQNYEPAQICAIINMSLADIYRAKLFRSSGKTYRECAEAFSYPKNREFAVRNAFSECGSVPIERIRKTLRLLSDYEFSLKTTSMNAEAAFLALEQFAAAAMA